jgi:hypothetical protein
MLKTSICAMYPCFCDDVRVTGLMTVFSTKTQYGKAHAVSRYGVDGDLSLVCTNEASTPEETLYSFFPRAILMIRKSRYHDT